MRPDPGISTSQPPGQEAGDIHLRLMQATDGSFYVGLFTCPRVMAAIGPALSHDVAEAAFVRACHYNTGNEPGHRFWIITDEDGAAAGLTSLIRDGDVAELGIMLRPDAWTGRWAKPALARVIHHAFSSMGLSALHARSADGVRARVSRRLLGPFPFVPEPQAPGLAGWTLSRESWARHSGTRADRIDPPSMTIPC